MANFSTEIECYQVNHIGERICGDVFLKKRINDEDRIICVFSDGMGHGVKANVLATLTSTISLNFVYEYKDIESLAETIMNTLPVCSERKISYSTFTIIDIQYDGEVKIIEYDNPQTIIMRGNTPLEVPWSCLLMSSDKNRGKKLHYCNFYLKQEDRIIFMSDGVVQSGMGSQKFPMGWERDNVIEYIRELITNDRNLSALKLASRIVLTANSNDGYNPKDDTSCGVIYFRVPRKLLICTGPPFNNEKDIEYSKIFDQFEGSKIICGGTSADIISRVLDREIVQDVDNFDNELPQTSMMDGADFITEGVLTLTKVESILKYYVTGQQLGRGPADRIVRKIIGSDEIHFLVGTGLNISHQMPDMPELEIRRSICRRIINLLENKYLKNVIIQYI